MNTIPNFPYTCHGHDYISKKNRVDRNDMYIFTVGFIFRTPTIMIVTITMFAIRMVTRMF